MGTKINKPSGSGLRLLGDSAGIRTQDPYIKSVMLYQLSYGINFLKRAANIRTFTCVPNFIVPCTKKSSVTLV